MLSLRHRRKAFVAAGVLGSGYFLYRIYAAHTQRISDLETQIDSHHEIDELIKAQLQTHFDNIQRISDSTTLPYAMQYLRFRISEELDLSHLTERLMQGKGQPNTLTPKEKLELWERLKILSMLWFYLLRSICFTRTALSLWAMTVLSLYIRVQVNILGRHLYIDTARSLGTSQVLDEAGPFDKRGQQEFLATADYFSNYGMSSLIPNMQKAATEVLKDKQLRDPFNTAQLHETIIQILESFMSMGGRHHWVSHLIPENAIVYKQLVTTSSNDFDGSALLADISKLDQLMAETRIVVSSDDFRNMAETSLQKVLAGLMEEVGTHVEGNPVLGVPLAKLLPHVARLGPQLLEEPNQNRYIQIIRSLPEVELFYTLLYANMP
ncbi:peroxisome biogenesis protein 3-2-like isoform X2 [Magnolia sinica]|uniref:peroxisome biogenesis protein 3-2-like isoform X2 n=1 Tax=Magnolia sinica TaxID=86752 RepID=UPI00265A7B4D|nr:peroxisome biogenesis protein 3-2-like isoform X2 [Magnolia sinica]